MYKRGLLCFAFTQAGFSDTTLQSRLIFELNKIEMSQLPEEIYLQFKSFTGIPFTAEIYAHNINIDWGDGSISTFRNNHYFSVRHLYQTEGCFTIQIRGINITGLQVSRLGLSLLSLPQCPHLEFLNCSVNELEYLDLTTCPVLEELSCNSNNLKHIDLSSVTKLVQINISYNLLTELDVSHCKSLQSLCCSYNQLQRISVPNCHHLNNLECSVNQLNEKQLSRIFKQLPTHTGKAMISYIGNPGANAINHLSLKAKNWY